MASKLTKKEKTFADAYLDTGNGTQSALTAYETWSENVAGNIAYENLRKPKIVEYLEANAGAVASNMVKLALTAKNEQTQVAAGKDVLDRAGYKPVEKTQSLNVSIDATAKNVDLEEIRLKYVAELKAKLLHGTTE